MPSTRTSLATGLKNEGHKAYEVTKEHLWELADVNHDGSITRDEFDKLHQVIVDNALEEVNKKHALEQANKVATRRARAATFGGVVMAIFLGISLLGNLGIVFYVVDSQVTTSADGTGHLRAKGSAAEVQVAQSGKEVMLGLLPFLPIAAPREAMGAMPESTS